MKKRILFYVLLFSLFLANSAACEELLERYLFVSLIQDTHVFSSRNEITRLIDFAKKARVKVLFVQIYRANVAMFKSEVGDSSLYETYRANLSEDPFKLLIKKAHKAGIEVHAWLNLLSLSNNKDAKLLKKYGLGILTRNKKEKKTIEDYKIDSQYFLEPGDLRVRAELSGMVREILLAYPDLDGIQFDYIRYPDSQPDYGYTEMNMERFMDATGHESVDGKSPEWLDWKRKQVNEFLETLVSQARSVRPYIKVSATACAPYCRAYLEAFQDWPLWLNSGLVDFVTLMSYSSDPKDFKKEVSEAKQRAEDFDKVKIGIGAYKFINSPGVFARELELCRESGARSCAIFHYGSLLEDRRLMDLLIEENKF